MKKAELIIIGAGSRGSRYAAYALEHPDEATIVGVAEPREPWRERLAGAHTIPREHEAVDWKVLSAKPNFADAVVIATQDAMHAEPAVAFARKGYHILLEKPMAPNEYDCRRIADEALCHDIILAVCHVMRYTPYTRKVKELVDSGIIGEVVSIQQLEPVGYWHQAHSFVRGNWRREDQSSPMLLAKCCHDLDWIRFVVGSDCTALQSFGTLKHFRPEQKPEGASSRCLDCSHEPHCPYSAIKIYLGRVADGQTAWPVDVLTPEVSAESVTEALRNGPYGRCVYECDNDVVDNQVVNMLFEAGQTASLTMTAFAAGRQRETRIFGTRGELAGDGTTIRHFDFLTDTWKQIDTHTGDHSILSGHGGGDLGLMKAFVHAVRNDDRSRILSGPRESLETHLMVFAAERSRRENRVVPMEEMFT